MLHIPRETNWFWDIQYGEGKYGKTVDLNILREAEGVGFENRGQIPQSRFLSRTVPEDNKEKRDGGWNDAMICTNGCKF